MFLIDYDFCFFFFVEIKRYIKANIVLEILFCICFYLSIIDNKGANLIYWILILKLGLVSFTFIFSPLFVFFSFKPFDYAESKT